MNDNWSTGWRSNLLGGGFKALGLLLFAGGIIGGIFGPSNAWQMLYVLMGIAGFAMVMV